MKYALALLAVISLVSIAGPSFAADEVLTNASITEMKSLGLGDDVIVSKIKSSTCKFDTTIPALRQLKDAQISDAIIQAMVASSTPAKPAVPAAPAVAAAPADPNDPKAPHQSGIYLFQEIDGKPKLTRMNPSRVEGLTTGSAWGAAFGGSMKTRAVLAGPHAEMQLSDPQPVFYFYFTKTETSLGSMDVSATSPDDFALGVMEGHKDHEAWVRRIEISKSSMGGYRTGLNKKDVRNFTTEKISDGIFKVAPASLEPGEYVFVQLMGANMVSTLKMFDFGIAGGK